MAVAFNNSDAQRTSGGTSITYSFTCSSGTDRFFIVSATDDGIANPPITSVTYNSVGLTAVSGTQPEVEMYQLVAPATGANNLTWNLSSYSFLHTAISDWTGVDQSTPLGTVVTNAGTSAAPTSGSVTCPSNGAVWGSEFSGYTTAGTPTAGAGTTLASAYRSGAGGRTGAGGYRLDTGALNWNIPSSAGWFAQGIPINAAGAGGGAATFMGRSIWMTA
jgi:hypothetical protein